MIILHFDLQPQFKYMNYFIYTSHQSTFNRETSQFILVLDQKPTVWRKICCNEPNEILRFLTFVSFVDFWCMKVIPTEHSYQKRCELSSTCCKLDSILLRHLLERQQNILESEDLLEFCGKRYKLISGLFTGICGSVVLLCKSMHGLIQAMDLRRQTL